jgi:hypothetical protein
MLLPVVHVPPIVEPAAEHTPDPPRKVGTGTAIADRRWALPFLHDFRLHRDVSRACRAAGIERGAAYEFRKASEEFRAAWDDAAERAVDDLEAATFDRAVRGWEEPVFHKGQRVRFTDDQGNVVWASIRRFDNTLSWKMLQAHRPDRYRFGVDAFGTDGPAGIAKALRDTMREMRASVDGPPADPAAPTPPAEGTA